MIAQRTVQAVFWNYTSFGLGKLLVFLTTAVLARLLAPEEFGVVAFATVAVSYLHVLNDLGLGAALIQRRQSVEEAAHTVFTLNLALGGLLTLAGYAMAPLVAAYFREPLVTPILRWLSLTFVVNALGSVHVVRLQRELAFRRKLLPDFGRSLVKGLVSIGCALSGLGVWALVIGQLAGAVAGVILAWLVFRWRPHLRVNRPLAASLLGFGLSVVGVDALATISDNLDYLIVGRVLGETALGIYTLAYRLPELLILNILWVMAAALFPAYASVQDRPELLRQGFLTTLRYVEILSLPLCLGLILAAEPLVLVAFGPQWTAAIPIVRILGLFALARSIGSNVGDVYKAVGRPGILFKLGLVNLAVLAPALWLGSRYGLAGVAWGHVAGGLFRTVLRLLVATRYVQVSLGDILAQLRPAFAGGIVLVALAWPILAWTQNLSSLIQLLAASAGGAAGYLAVLWWLERDSLLRVRRLIMVKG